MTPKLAEQTARYVNALTETDWRRLQQEKQLPFCSLKP